MATKQWVMIGLVAAPLWGIEAAADCQPDPPMSGGGVTCSGTDTNGFRVVGAGVSDLTVVVEDDANVSAAVFGAIYLRGDGHSLTNLGVIDTAGGIAPAVIFDRGAGLTLSNAGRIQSGVAGGTTFGNGALDLQAVNGATITNAVGGVIEGLSGNAIRIAANSNDNGGAPILFDIQNDGLIRAGSITTASGVAGGSGIVFNTQPAVGLGGIVDVRIVNRGRIEAGDAVIGNSVQTNAPTGGRLFFLDNGGELVSRGESTARTVQIAAGGASVFQQIDVRNSGLIEGTGGVLLGARESIVFDNALGGTVRGNQFNVVDLAPSPVAAATLVSVTLTNAGTIEATGATQQNRGIGLIGPSVVNLHNTGSITSAGGNAVNINSTGFSFNAPGRVIVRNDGSISAAGATADALIVQGSDVQITNAGTISVGTPSSSVAVDVLGAQTLPSNLVLTNESTGVITGNVALSAAGGQVRVDNAGRIDGDLATLGATTVVHAGEVGGVTLGDDGNVFQWLGTGRVLTDLRSGAGHDVLQMLPGASGIQLPNGLTIVGFEELLIEAQDVTAEGRVSLDQRLDLASSSLEAGEFRVIRGELFLSADGFIDGADGSVESEGRLTGTGLVAGNLLVQGLIGPGTSIGTLRIGGNFTLDPTGVLVIEFDGTSADLVDIAGAASIAGRLELRLPADLDGDFDFVILEADGGVTGTFSAVTIPGNNTVTAADVLFEPNRIRVALSATADPDPSPDPDPDPDPPPTGDPRVRQLYVAAPALVAQQGTRTTHDVVMRRLSGGSVNSCAAASGFAWRSTTAGCSDAAGDDGFAALAALAVLAGSGVMDRRDLAVASVPLFKDGERQSVVDVVNADRWTGYVGGSYDSGRFNDDAPRSGLDYASATVLFGLDYRVTPRTVIGGAVSFGAADADYRHDGKLDSDSRTGSLYAGWAGSTGYYVSGTLSYGTSDIDQWRYVDPDDANAGRVRSSTDSTQTGASVLFGRDVTVGRQTFGAFGKILIGDVHVDGYTEEGPTTDPSVFRVGGTDSDSRIGAAGARWALFTPRATGHWVTQLRASYEHEFEGSADQVTTLSGAGAALTIPFDQPERSWWRAGASFAWVKRPSTVVGLSYDVTFAHDNQRIGTLALGVRHRF